MRQSRVGACAVSCSASRLPPIPGSRTTCGVGPSRSFYGPGPESGRVFREAGFELDHFLVGHRTFDARKQSEDGNLIDGTAETDHRGPEGTGWAGSWDRSAVVRFHTRNFQERTM